MFNKFHLRTYHLKVPSRQTNYVYVNVRHAKTFSYKEILTLENQHFGHGCIIQYR